MAHRDATVCSRYLTWPRAAAVAGLLLVGLMGCATQEPAPVVTRESEPLGAEGRPRDYRVARGDSLYSIAWRYDLDYRQVAAWNGIGPPYLIYAGQDLHLYPNAVVPNPGSGVPAAAASPSDSSGTDEEVPLRATVGTKPPATHPTPRGRRAAAARATRSHPAAQAGPIHQGESGADTPADNHWIWPTRGQVVQTFAKGDRTRQGIRIAGNLGQDVVAAESGRVVYSGSGLPGYGQLIIIKHTKNYLSAYGFNRRLLVRDGSAVTRGARVAEMGSSADGKPMLHFEIRHGDTVLDPMQFLPSR